MAAICLGLNVLTRFFNPDRDIDIAGSNEPKQKSVIWLYLVEIYVLCWSYVLVRVEYNW